MEDAKNLLKGTWISVPLILKALSVSVVITWLWTVYRSGLYCFFGLTADSLGVDELGSDLTVFMPCMVYATVMGFVLNRVNGQNNRIKSAIITLNAITFLEERDLRTRPVMHVAMGIISLYTGLMLAIYHYSSIQIAWMVIGGYVFLAVFMYLTVIELDNPFSGTDRIDRKKVPDGWMDMDIYHILDNQVLHANNTELLEKRRTQSKRSVSDLA